MTKLRNAVLGLIALTATMCITATAKVVAPIVLCDDECWERCLKIGSDQDYACKSHSEGSRIEGESSTQQSRRLQEPMNAALAPAGPNVTLSPAVLESAPSATAPIDVGVAPSSTLAPAPPPLGYPSAPVAPAAPLAPTTSPTAINVTSPTAVNVTSPNNIAPSEPVITPMAIPTTSPPSASPSETPSTNSPRTAPAPVAGTHSANKPVKEPKVNAPAPESEGISAGGIFGVVVALLIVFGVGAYFMFGRGGSSSSRYSPDGMRQMEVGRYNSRDDDNGLL